MKCARVSAFWVGSLALAALWCLLPAAPDRAAGPSVHCPACTPSTDVGIGSLMSVYLSSGEDPYTSWYDTPIGITDFNSTYDWFSPWEEAPDGGSQASVEVKAYSDHWKVVVDFKWWDAVGHQWQAGPYGSVNLPAPSDCTATPLISCNVRLSDGSTCGVLVYKPVGGGGG